MRPYDYIIVGAGSAGCVLANRLSEDPSKRVLLLEAGPTHANPLFNIPLVGPAFGVGRKKLDWCYKTQPDATRRNKVQDWPRGKMLGGSSRINGMVYVRGARADFDDWATSGCAGWAWSDVEPYFRLSENIEPVDAIHGNNGPIKLSRLRRPHALSQAFIQAHEDIGYTNNPDYNGETQTGAAILISSNNGRTRSSASSAYLTRHHARKNLVIQTQAHVERIIFRDGRATGLDYTHRGTRHRVTVTREIIVCAGTIGSPSLLMRSGVGPGDHLQKLGIPLIQDRPSVGDNLHEHPALQLIIRSNTQTIGSQYKPWHFAGHIWNWTIHRGGLLSAATYEAISFIHSGDRRSRPDIQMHFAPYALARTPKGLQPLLNDSFMIQVNTSYPKSRGHIRLVSRDIAIAPEIHHALFDNTEDLQTLRKAVRIAVRILKTDVMRGHVDQVLLPDCDLESDDALDAALLEHAVPAYHPAGTCRMGNDPSAVVDPHLKIQGLDGIRVADASIMPSPISGNIQACVTMIAEKAASIIKQEEKVGLICAQR